VRTDKATMVVTVVTAAVGTVLVAMGIALLVLPGPGLLLIAAGLALLARNFAWAEHLLHRARTTLEERRGHRDARGDAAATGSSPVDPAAGPGEGGRPPAGAQGDTDAASGGDASVMPAA